MIPTLSTMSSPDGFTEYVARVIDAERTAARLSVDELADRSGVPTRTLYRVLSAERDITIRQLAQLAPVFGLKPSDIFADAERRMKRDAPKTGGGGTLGWAEWWWPGLKKQEG